LVKRLSRPGRVLDLRSSRASAHGLRPLHGRPQALPRSARRTDHGTSTTSSTSRVIGGTTAADSSPSTNDSTAKDSVPGCSSAPWRLSPSRRAQLAARLRTQDALSHLLAIADGAHPHDFGAVSSNGPVS